MPKTDIWMPIFIGDYLSDTMHLTTVEHGAYLLLMMHYWKNGGPIPYSKERMASICRLDVSAWSMLEAVLKQYFDDACYPGFWSHSRIDKELSAAIARKEIAVNKARNAALARHNRQIK